MNTNSTMMPPPMMSMQHRMPSPYGGGMPPFGPPGGAPFGMPPPNFPPFGAGYGPPQGWGNDTVELIKNSIFFQAIKIFKYITF